MALAVELCAAHAAAGDLQALGMLAFCYQLGFGVERNLNEAIRLYTECFHRGGWGSANNLALIYYEELERTPENKEKARFWYQKSKDHDCRCIIIPEFDE